MGFSDLSDLMHHLPLMALLLPSQVIGLVNFKLMTLVMKFGDLRQKSFELILMVFLLSFQLNHDISHLVIDPSCIRLILPVTNIKFNSKTVD